ncbi:glycosyltransferase family 4 protein [Vibrio breoganii]
MLKNIDLSVIFYDVIDKKRVSLGWSPEINCNFDHYNINDRNDLDELLDKFEDHVHIVPGFRHGLLSRLIGKLNKKGINWVHWSERSGVGVAKLCRFNYKLFNVIYPFFLFFSGYYRYARLVNKYALGSLAIGDLAKTDFQRWGIKNSIETVPYSLYGSNIMKDHDVNYNKVRFIYLGSLYPLKGIDELLMAAYRLSMETTNFEIWFVGNDLSNGKYIRLTEEYGLDKMVNFIGPKKHTEVYEFLGNSDVLILPTKFDGWGAVLNEAASVGLPLISTYQSGAATCFIEQNRNGFIYQPHDINSLINAMNYYIKDPQLLSKHGQISRSKYLKTTPDKVAIRFVDAIKKFQDYR